MRNQFKTDKMSYAIYFEGKFDLARYPDIRTRIAIAKKIHRKFTRKYAFSLDYAEKSQLVVTPDGRLIVKFDMISKEKKAARAVKYLHTLCNKWTI